MVSDEGSSGLGRVIGVAEEGGELSCSRHGP